MVTRAQLDAQDVVVRQEYDGLAKEWSDKTALVCDPELVVLVPGEDGKVIETYPGRSLTRQSEKDSADINVILDRMSQQGIGPVLNPYEPRFLDISQVGDYRQAIQQVREANAYFMQLDAEDRQRFNNDPARFLDAVNDPAQLDALIKEGVVVDGTIVGGPPVAPEASASGAPGK